MVGVALVIAAAMVVTDYWYRKKQLKQDFQVVVRSVAGTAALSLSGEEIMTIRSNADVTSEAFRKARAHLEKVRAINHLTEREIYILRPVAWNRFETEFVVMLHENPFVGDRYTILEQNREPFYLALTRYQPQHTDIYSDAHGTWISGYAPIFDNEGKAVAVVEVDAEISKFLARLRKELATSVAIGLDALAVALIPVIIFARRLTRGITDLSAGIQRFQKGEHDVQVKVDSRDEVRELAEVFNQMVLSLREKLALLPFVSRFTAEAVRRSQQDPSWLSGSEHDVVVIFADLRGFTRFSEKREAKGLVHELNRLLGVQAEVVLSAGGDVDKFVGDAIMAVFFDEKDGPVKAFACAKEMLRRVHQETTANGWSLGLGIGVHCGRVVVGSIGSDTRRDFTAIGHTVNLASRLCDKAEAWQILVSEDFRKSLPADTQDDFLKTEPIQFKNVQQSVTTYVFSCAKCPSTGQIVSLEEAAAV